MTALGQVPAPVQGTLLAPSCAKTADSPRQIREVGRPNEVVYVNRGTQLRPMWAVAEASSAREAA